MPAPPKQSSSLIAHVLPSDGGASQQEVEEQLKSTPVILRHGYTLAEEEHHAEFDLAAARKSKTVKEACFHEEEESDM